MHHDIKELKQEPETPLITKLDSGLPGRYSRVKALVEVYISVSHWELSHYYTEKVIIQSESVNIVIYQDQLFQINFQKSLKPH